MRYPSFAEEKKLWKQGKKIIEGISIYTKEILRYHKKYEGGQSRRWNKPNATLITFSQGRGQRQLWPIQGRSCPRPFLFHTFVLS